MVAGLGALPAREFVSGEDAFLAPNGSLFLSGIGGRGGAEYTRPVKTNVCATLGNVLLQVAPEVAWKFDVGECDGKVVEHLFVVAPRAFHNVAVVGFVVVEQTE